MAAEADQRRAAARNGGSRLVLLGPPGAGKGTQAQILSTRLGVPAISTGDLLRAAVAEDSELGRRVAGIMAHGALVDDGTMGEVVCDRLERPDTRAGFLLDGYPRTLPQAESLAGILGRSSRPLDLVLLVDVGEDELVRRAVARGRSDDKEEVVRERLRLYREKTEPLIGYYRDRGLLRVVDGSRPIAEVTAQLLDVCGLCGVSGVCGVAE